MVSHVTAITAGPFPWLWISFVTFKTLVLDTRQEKIGDAD
jgi:hypothetical protein